MTALYSRITNTIVRHLKHGAKQHKLLGSNGLSLVPPDNETYETPILARGVSILFFNVMWSPDGFQRGGFWARIDRVDLASGRQETVLEVPDIEHLEVPGARPWVSDILDASDDGETLTVILGVPIAIEDGSRMDYGVFDLNIRTKALVKLVQLESPF